MSSASSSTPLAASTTSPARWTAARWPLTRPAVSYRSTGSRPTSVRYSSTVVSDQATSTGSGASRIGKGYQPYPRRHGAEVVRDPVIHALSQLRARLCRSLACEQSKEMAHARRDHPAAGMPVFSARNASPWRRPLTRRRSRWPKKRSPSEIEQRADQNKTQVVAYACEQPKQHQRRTRESKILEELDLLHLLGLRV